MKLITTNKFNKLYVLIILIHVAALSQLIFFPYPELFIYSYLTDHGLIPYKQIFDQHFPGIMFLPVNLYSLGINTLNEMRVVHISLIVFSDIIFIKVLKFLFKNKLHIFIGFIGYTFWQIYLEGHVLWIESFITPLLLMGFYFSIKYLTNRKLNELLLASVLFGLSLIFKQTAAPLIFLIFTYLLLIKVNIKHLLYGGIILVLPVALTMMYFYRLGALNNLLYWTITFNLTVFSDMGRTYPDLRAASKLFPIFGFSILYLVYALMNRRKYSSILGIFLFGSLFFSFARFDFIHFQPALPYSMILLVFLLSEIKKPIILIFLYTALSFYIFIPVFRFNHNPGISPMFNDTVTKKIIEVVNDNTTPGDKIVAIGTYPHIYYLTDTLPSGDVFTFQFPWFMKVAEKSILEGIIRDPPKLVIRDSGSQVGQYYLIDYMKLINDHIDSNYIEAYRVNGTEILVKI